MKWSRKIGEVDRISLRIHAMLVVLPGSVLLNHWMVGKSMNAALDFIVAL
jgi:hypothetical protein